MQSRERERESKNFCTMGGLADASRVKRMPLATLFLAAVVAKMSAYVCVSQPIVRLPSGASVVGSRTASAVNVAGGVEVDIYKGIKYGHIPARFEPAVATAVGGKGTTFNAIEFGPMCIQSERKWLGAKPAMGEDCLYLNVYRPATSAASALPVMVWIHGGGFTSGAGSAFDAINLAASQNVVVVTINYRLGPLGFLAKDSQGKGAMNGNLDQILALRWVQKNIASFGGNPKRVTIFGESAGALSVCALIVLPAARGLMSRAIMESGACNSVLWGPATHSDAWAKTQLFF